MPFPGGFLWGAATSAYQVEGATHVDGRGESIWDRFARRPGAIEGGATGDVAAHHYERWRADVELMASLGLRAYRFSLAWPRILPEGSGSIERRGLDFYERLVDGLLEKGIEPVPTLYHWDLPQALEDRGGWVTRETAERFGEYASLVFEALGDRVRTWITLNEPWVSAFVGYHAGVHAPGRHDLRAAIRASHHLLIAHARAVEAYRALGTGGRIGITLDLQVSSPASASEEDARAVALAEGTTSRWFLDPVLLGDYPAEIAELFVSRGAAVHEAIEPGDMAAISAPLDFLGVNYYFRRFVRLSAEGLGWTEVPPPPDAPRTTPNEMGWHTDPSALEERFAGLRAGYPPLPIFVTENGMALRDEVDADGEVHDEPRIEYLRDHIASIERAIEAGSDIRGYFVWSLLDNFEWTLGYRPRFGLVHVDFDSQRRTPKASARWYAEVIRRNGLPG